jgi:hypothetical protein
VRRSDVWLFRIGSAVVTYVAVVFGCRYAGHYLHEREAYDRAHRERSIADQKEDAKFLSQGYSDTEGYRYLESDLAPADRTTAFSKPHWLDELRVKIAAGAALAIAILGGESARIWAVKQDAKRRISGRWNP